MLSPYEFGLLLEFGLAREDTGYKGVELVENAHAFPALVPVFATCLRPVNQPMRLYERCRAWCREKLVEEAELATRSRAGGHRKRLTTWLQMEAVHRSVAEPEAQLVCTAAARCEALREEPWELGVRERHARVDDVFGISADVVLGEQESLTLRSVFVPAALLGKDPQTCKRCGKADARFKCSRCKRAHYCGADCFRADWKAVHRRVCGKAPAPKRPVATFTAEEERAINELADGSWNPNHEWGISDEAMAEAAAREFQDFRPAEHTFS